MTLLKIAPSADLFRNVLGAKEYSQTCDPDPSASAIPNLVSRPDFLHSVSFCLKHVILMSVKLALTAYKGMWRWAELRGLLQWAGSLVPNC